MDSVTRAVRRIDDVLGAELAPHMAYPLRARLGRAVMESIDCLNSGSCGNAEAREALARLASSSEHIMQPSEPFDAHWRAQWHGVLRDLVTVRRSLEDRG